MNNKQEARENQTQNTNVMDQKCIVQKDKTNLKQTKKSNKNNKIKGSESTNSFTKQRWDQVLQKDKHPLFCAQQPIIGISCPSRNTRRILLLRV